jgi:hypothetical protein
METLDARKARYFASGDSLRRMGPSMAGVLVIPLSFQQFQLLFHLCAAHLRVA